MNKYKPGEGRRKKIAFDKGRQIDPDAVDELKNLLNNIEIRRDLLIEYLHIINDHFFCCNIKIILNFLLTQDD